MSKPTRRAIIGSASWLLIAASGIAAAEPVAEPSREAPHSVPVPATAQPVASVELAPARVRPGDAFLVKVHVSGVGASGVDPSRLEGSAAGRPLSFFLVLDGAAAFGALPLEIPAGLLPVQVRLGREARTVDLDVAAPAFPHRDLQVDREFVSPPTPAIQARIEEDRAAFARAFSQPPAPPLFTARFAPPRKARVTAGYGEERTFNATRPSQHYGQDLAGKVGAPVVAANAGEVVLARDCWASGSSVILWHGAGIYTTYFHLSKMLVKPGERVARGQRIGLVGRSGRVNGPHLHWGVRIGDLYVDPASVLRLAFPTAR
jgi:murein DD-endopeptidase MepM/ murein hydrolase activator NlpD